MYNWFRVGPVPGPFGNGNEHYGCVQFRTGVGFRGDYWLLNKTPVQCDNYTTKFRRSSISGSLKSVTPKSYFSKC